MNERLTPITVAHLGARAFEEVPGEVVQTAAFSSYRGPVGDFIGTYYRLTKASSSEEKRELLLARSNCYRSRLTDFSLFPRCAMIYYASERTKEAFRNGITLGDFADVATGLQTGNNPRFIKYWFEVSREMIQREAKSCAHAEQIGGRWFPYVKGSEYRKWYGSQLCILDWRDDGREIRHHPSSAVRNPDFYFRPGIAYNNISKVFCARAVDAGAIFDQKNSMIFPRNDEDRAGILALLA